MTKTFNILTLPGDGIGREVMPEGVRALTIVCFGGGAPGPLWRKVLKMHDFLKRHTRHHPDSLPRIADA